MVRLLQNTSFIWLLVILGITATFFAVRAWMLNRQIVKDAGDDWDYQVSENMQDLRLTREAYIRAYTKINAPRNAKYSAMALMTILAFAVPSFALIQSTMHGIWKISGQSPVFEPPFLVYQFMVFFSAIVLWILVIGWFIRRYYKNAPGMLRDELTFEKAGFKPQGKLTVGANPTHIDANAYIDEKSIDGKLVETIDIGFFRKDYEAIFSEALGLSKQIDKDWNGSGHICDIYSSGSDMEICVHTASDKNGLTKETHPFFYPGAFARHDDKEIQYTIIVSASNAYVAFEKILSSGIPILSSSGSETSRQCNIKTDDMDIYIYDERWS